MAKRKVTKRKSEAVRASPWQVGWKLMLIGIVIYIALGVPIVILNLAIENAGVSMLLTLLHFALSLFLSGYVVIKRKKWLFENSWI
jgi:hypothetical protein